MRLSLTIPLLTLLLACTTEQDLGSNKRSGATISSTGEVIPGDTSGTGGIGAFCATHMDSGDGCYCDCIDVDPDCTPDLCTAGTGGVGQPGTGGAPGTGGLGGGAGAGGLVISPQCAGIDFSGQSCHCLCRDLDPGCQGMENGCYAGSYSYPASSPVPPDWTCFPTWYADGLYCDPNCGAPDPDC